MIYFRVLGFGFVPYKSIAEVSLDMFGYFVVESTASTHPP